MRTFEFKKTYEEIKINDKTYKIEFNDDKINEYQKAFENFYFKSQEKQKIDINKLNKEEEKQFIEESVQLAKEALETLLGEGTYDILYEESGRSLINMVDLISFLADIVNEKTSQEKQKRVDKYLKNKKKVNK